MAISIFARIGDIKGESQDKGHEDEIDVLSWSWGVSQSGSMAHGGGGGQGKASFQDLSFTHRIDRATPALFRACATGQHLKDATITVRRGGGRGQAEFLVVKLTDVLVTSVSDAGTANGDPPFEAVSIAFGKVDLEYRPQKPDGSLDSALAFAFDLAANKEG
ncbi:MAG TPA: type VI secretion system tube protein Hcp [Candidatus Limnocylindrales bacterium]|jgi:type VI secretion system secreted protein Hcp